MQEDEERSVNHESNITQSIKQKMGANLHLRDNHPVGIVKKFLLSALEGFTVFESIDPVVTVQNNFDSLRIPQDHPSRRRSDTYYVDNSHVLRTHTSAHQVELMRAGHRKFVVIGDVYRNDDIDPAHYPVFHQMEGVCVLDPSSDPSDPEKELKETLSRLLDSVFPSACWRLKPDYFPFTEPSWEAEVEWDGEWLEVLGCGVVHPEVLENAGIRDKTGWAFGIGLDRIAMKTCSIPDIRLLWTKDEGFSNQYEDGKLNKFIPFSKHPGCYKDISMWVNQSFQPRDLLGLVREIGGPMVERVDRIDEFDHPKHGKSMTYRIMYRSWERTLSNEEVDVVQEEIRRCVKDKLSVELR